MTDEQFRLARRPFLAGLTATLGSAFPVVALGQTKPRATLSLKAAPATLALRDGAPSPIWTLQSEPAIPRFKRGDEIAINFANGLPIPAALSLRGLDGAPDALTARPPVAPGASATINVALTQAGTMTLDTRLLGDGADRASPMLPFIVEEREPPTVDRDEVVVIEDWRLRTDGAPGAPGVETKDIASATYTANRKPEIEVKARANDRIRFRFINGCQRSVISIKIDEIDVRVVAIDSQLSEPFPARGGQLILAPGTRIDALVDVTKPAGSTVPILLHDGVAARSIAKIVVTNDAPARPKPLPDAPPLASNGLPETLDLKSALRVDLELGAPPAWVAPGKWTPNSAPAFTAKRGRTIVLALTNKAAIATIFRLGGHHARLLDRLDDGWKPFWLDTIVIGPQQTQRIAFAAEHPGRWLIEAVGTDWTSPRLVQSFVVQ